MSKLFDFIIGKNFPLTICQAMVPHDVDKFHICQQACKRSFYQLNLLGFPYSYIGDGSLVFLLNSILRGFFLPNTNFVSVFVRKDITCDLPSLVYSISTITNGTSSTVILIFSTGVTRVINITFF